MTEELDVLGTVTRRLDEAGIPYMLTDRAYLARWIDALGLELDGVEQGWLLLHLVEPAGMKRLSKCSETGPARTPGAARDHEDPRSQKSRRTPRPSGSTAGRTLASLRLPRNEA